MNFKSEVCSNSSFPTDALVWINEIDSAKNVDDLKSSNPILGRMRPVFEVLDSKIASALKKLLTAAEEAKAQQDSRFLKIRQIAYMIHENFKISGTGEALLDANDLLKEQVT